MSDPKFSSSSDVPSSSDGAAMAVETIAFELRQMAGAIPSGVKERVWARVTEQIEAEPELRSARGA